MLLFIYSFICMPHFEPLLLLGTSPWSKGTNPSLPAKRLTFWSHGSDRHSRTASTYVKQTQSTTFLTHALTLSVVEIEYHEEKNNASRLEPWSSPPKRLQSDHYTNGVRWLWCATSNQPIVQSMLSQLFNVITSWMKVVHSRQNETYKTGQKW